MGLHPTETQSHGQNFIFPTTAVEILIKYDFLAGKLLQYFEQS